jgi:hypothetical protein
MTREDIATQRAMKLYDLALSVVRAKGRIIVEGSESVVKYRHGLLDIHYRPDREQLDVWFHRRVLSVHNSRRKTQLMHYLPGHWELDLIGAAKVAA